MSSPLVSSVDFGILVPSLFYVVAVIFLLSFSNRYVKISGSGITTLEKSGKDVKLHSKRVEKM